MNRKSLLVALNLLLTGAMATAAAADHMGPNVEVGFGVGGAIPTADLREQDGFDLLSSGWAIRGYVTGEIDGPLGWRAEVAYNDMGYGRDARDACPDCDNSPITDFGGGIQLNIGEDSDVRPYMFLTLGGYHVDPNLPASYNADPETYFGIGFGGGVNFLIGRNWGLGGDVHIHRFFPGDHSDLFDRHNNDPWYVVPTGQIFWRF